MILIERIALNEPKKEYFELLAHPEYNKLYTFIDDIANIINKLKLCS